MFEFFIENPQLIGRVETLLTQWLIVFSIDLARYLLGVGLVSYTLLVLFRSFSEQRRIQHRRAGKADLKRELQYSLLTITVYASVALFTLEAIERGWMRVYEEINSFGWTYLIMCIPGLLILHDSYFYWVHRLMHHPRLFGRVHRIHHLSLTPTSWAAYSFSAWEALLMTLFVPIVMAVIPLHPIALFVFLAIMILRNAMGHSGIEFHPSWWVDSPFDCLTTVTHHDLHHQKFKGNYGLYFTWWDRWMGTELPGYKPAFRKVTTTCDTKANTLKTERVV